MKTNLRILFIILGVMFSMHMYAQGRNSGNKGENNREESFNVFRNLFKEYEKNKSEKDALLLEIKTLESDSVKYCENWKNICIPYLKENKLRLEELESLIGQTYPDVDGENLLRELKRAKECLESSRQYKYGVEESSSDRDSQNVNPGKDAVVVPVNEDAKLTTPTNSTRPIGFTHVQKNEQGIK